MPGIAALIFALLKAVPALRDIFNQVIELDRKHNEAEATARLVAKDAAVDAGIDAILHPDAGVTNRPGVSPTPPLGQLETSPGASRLPRSGLFGTGMGKGRSENDKRA